MTRYEWTDPVEPKKHNLGCPALIDNEEPCICDELEQEAEEQAGEARKEVE